MLRPINQSAGIRIERNILLAYLRKTKSKLVPFNDKHQNLPDIVRLYRIVHGQQQFDIVVHAWQSYFVVSIVTIRVMSPAQQLVYIHGLDLAPVALNSTYDVLYRLLSGNGL